MAPKRVVGIRLPAELWADLEAEAKKDRRSISTWVALCVEDELLRRRESAKKKK